MISYFLLIINIFNIRGWYDISSQTYEWWKVVFVLDVSKSMNTYDIVENDMWVSRIDMAKTVIYNYILEHLENQYGLMIFAWEALEILPFTNDASVFKTILYGISNSNISKNGTDLNSVFLSLQNYFISDEEWWLVVIMTDGWDEEIDIDSELMKQLQEKNIQIILLWVGSERWWKIPIGKDFFWNMIYKTYNGEEVVSQLNESELKNIASKYDLDYMSLSNQNDVKEIEKYISKNISYISMEKWLESRYDFTRLIVLFSFIFFILFLIIDRWIIWKN